MSQICRVQRSGANGVPHRTTYVHECHKFARYREVGKMVFHTGQSVYMNITKLQGTGSGTIGVLHPLFDHDKIVQVGVCLTHVHTLHAEKRSDSGLSLPGLTPPTLPLTFGQFSPASTGLFFLPKKCSKETTFFFSTLPEYRYMG